MTGYKAYPFKGWRCPKKNVLPITYRRKNKQTFPRITLVKASYKIEALKICERAVP